MNRLNILYIHSHDTGRYIQPYGHAVATPNLQRLAEDGVLFHQCFCGGPTCSPSRAVLVTGQYAHCNGMVGLAHRGFYLNDYSHHMLHTLREAGYHSALAGVQHIVRNDEVDKIGYDAVLTQDTAASEEPACAFLDDGPAQPFFLSVGFGLTHREFPEPGPAEDPRNAIPAKAGTLPPAPLPNTPETRRDTAQFNAAARLLDEKMGKVFDALERNNLADNTLVICTTDHGMAFPRMKCNLTDAGIGVFLIVRGPGGFSGGQVVDALVSHVDLYPTVCDLLDVDPPAHLQGVSLMPLVRGEKRTVREEVFAEVSYHAAYEPMRCVRTARYKYIRRYDGRDRPVLCNCDDSVSKDVWLDAGWAGRAPEEEALYDLVFDPNETCNLAGRPEAEPMLGEMRARLERWMRETGDPLLEGPVPIPKGAIVNDVDSLSPRERPKAPSA